MTCRHVIREGSRLFSRTLCIRARDREVGVQQADATAYGRLVFPATRGIEPRRRVAAVGPDPQIAAHAQAIAFNLIAWENDAANSDPMLLAGDLKRGSEIGAKGLFVGTALQAVVM